MTEFIAGNETPATVETPVTTTENVAVETPTETASTPWYESLSEDYKSNEKLTSFADVNELAKSWTEAQSLIGRKGIIKPDENSTPEQINEYYTAIGRPENIDGYTADLPEGFNLDPELHNATKEALFNAGITGDQYGMLMDLYVQDITRLQEGMQSQQEATTVAQANEWHTELQSEWGNEYQANADVINDFFNKEENIALADLLVDKGLGNNPQIANMILKYTQAVSEDTVVGSPNGGNTTDLKVQASTLQKELLNMSKNDPSRASKQAKLNDLYDMMNPN